MDILSFHDDANIEEIHYKISNNNRVFIKRDDAIDPLISGNKWWKLKYSLIDAMHRQKKTLVSFGGAYSNHLIALSSAAARFGFQSVAFIRSDEGIPQNICTSICRSMGMELIAVSREDYKDKKSLFDKYFGENQDAYFVDEGGLSALGAKGMEESLQKLNQTYDHIFLAAGTGCSSAGVLNYVHSHQLHSTVHAVIVHNGLDEVLQNIEVLSNTNQLQLHDTASFGRYAKHNQELVDFCIDFQKNTGIMLDLVYTAKAMYKMYEELKNYENQTILFIHTGGLWGNVGKINAFFSESN